MYLMPGAAAIENSQSVTRSRKVYKQTAVPEIIVHTKLVLTRSTPSHSFWYLSPNLVLLSSIANL